jgi:hypothetical protein
MKRLLTLFLIIFVFGNNIYSQTYEILNDLGGELEEFKSLYDGEELFGYLELHKLDKLDSRKYKYKYIVLDKNFNKISTNEFVISRQVPNQRLSQALFNKGKVLLGFSELASGGFYKNQQYILIDIKTAEVKNAFTLQNYQLMAVENTVLKDNFDKFYNEGGLAYKAKDRGFLLVNRSLNGSYSFMKNGIFIDLEGNQKWILPTKTGETPEHFYEYDFLANDEKSIALRANYFKKKKYLSSKLLILDTENGNESAFAPMDEAGKKLVINTVKFIDDELVSIGEFFNGDQTSAALIINKLGIFKKSYKRNGGSVVTRSFVPFTDLAAYVPIDVNGKIAKEGYLDFKDFEIRPDGTHLVFGETFKSDFMSGGYKFTELFYLILDKDFKVIKMASNEVNKSLYPKYRYGQSIQNNNGYASFFIDPDQEKKLVLNVLVYNDATKAFKLEKIDLEKKDSNTWFFAAKNGYVGLIEYFKKDKKNPRGKQAELHLEKIYIE